MANSPIYFGVNIDHIATLRQQRQTRYPDPVHAALLAEQAGADGITLHLREDRRHIQERDVSLLKDLLQTRMNLELAANEEMIVFAEKIQPDHCCLVPEKREELTTEGGLDVVKQQGELEVVCHRLAQAGIQVSLFIDPELVQIEAALACGVSTIELHTGCYADVCHPHDITSEYQRLIVAAEYAKKQGLVVNAGHGLHYHNVQAIARIPQVNELNIGHAIIAHACFVGIAQAVREMKALIQTAR